MTDPKTDPKAADAQSASRQLALEHPADPAAANSLSDGKKPAGPDLGELLDAIDAKARAQGASLIGILIKTAKDQLGIDISPDPPAEPHPDAKAPRGPAEAADGAPSPPGPLKA